SVMVSRWQHGLNGIVHDDCGGTIRPLFFFFFNDTATTEIYTLSLHDALPISTPISSGCSGAIIWAGPLPPICRDRKSTRLNSSHMSISYAVFCLKKKKHEKTKLHVSSSLSQYEHNASDCIR